LYRVCVPLHDDGKAPLVSIWIDPALTNSSLKKQLRTRWKDTGQVMRTGLRENI
jgi:hypothetical protein